MDAGVGVVVWILHNVPRKTCYGMKIIGENSGSGFWIDHR
jgi:hypothetical protein